MNRVSSQKIDTSSDLTLTPMNNLIALDKKNDKLKTLEPSTSILNLKKRLPNHEKNNKTKQLRIKVRILFRRKKKLV